MYQRLTEQFGEAQIEQILKQNVEESVTGQAMQIVNALWDNRDQLQAAVTDADQPPASLEDEDL